MLKHLLSLTFLIFGILNAQPRLALMDFSGESMSRQNLQSLNRNLRAELLKVDTLGVLDRDEMIFALDNHGFDPVCNNYDCAVVAGLLLNMAQVITLDISKVGEVFVVKGLLYDVKAGLVLNRVIYDHEYTFEGLQNRGIKNIAVMLMTNRIPMVVHKSDQQIYIQSIPGGATLKIGAKLYPESTPFAIDRVIIESQRVTLIKENYEDYVIAGLPPDESRVILARLNLLDPTLLQGDLILDQPVPDGIMVISSAEDTSLQIPSGATEMSGIHKGQYRLSSNDYIIQNGIFKIKALKSTYLSPRFLLRSKLEKQLKRHKLRRTLYLTGAALLMGYAGFLDQEAGKKYETYSRDTSDPGAIRSQVTKMDRSIPYLLYSGLTFILPAIHQQYQIFSLKKILEK
ncbi:MAG: hypothetical protein V3S22_04015 [Candidatus Neomarinimicrobiota bacterium]